MGIGARLKEIIDSKGTNVSQIAKQTNISPMTIYSIIKRDNTKVDIEILLKICEFLNVSVEEVYQPNFQKDNSNTIDLDKDERELIGLFRQLNTKDKQRYIGRMEETINSYTPEQKEEIA